MLALIFAQTRYNLNPNDLSRHRTSDKLSKCRAIAIAGYSLFSKQVLPDRACVFTGAKYTLPKHPQRNHTGVIPYSKLKLLLVDSSQWSVDRKI